ncbi:MAG: molybdopterin-dependent oxidoreductase [Dehalococcoidia bacterium]|nr:molybdopterin-dependent oxidoreductase [Dehalococcoidia bacterium]
MEEREKTVRTVCAMGCGMACGLLAHVRDGALTKIEPADFPDPKYRHLCARALATIKLVYHPDRLKYPLKRLGERGEGKWQRISWDEALETIAARLKEIGERHGWRSLMWETAGIGALDTAYARFAGCLEATGVSLIGFGDAAGPCGDRASFGTLWGEAYQTDFEEPAMCVLWGNNPAETQPFGMRKLMDAKEKGARVVVIDPRFTPTASKADEYIPIRPGTDTALALGLMHVILEERLHDPSFVAQYTVGPFLVNSRTGLFLREADVLPGSSGKYLVWDSPTGQARAYDAPEAAPTLTGVYSVGGVDCRPAFQLLADLAGDYPPEKVSEITGVPADTIRRLALDYARRRPVASFRGMGMQRTFHGDLGFRAISTLAAITGNIKPAGPRTFVLNMKAFMRAGGRVHFIPVLKVYDAIAKGDPYPIKALWIAKHNMLNQLPDASLITRELLPHLEFIVVADLFMNTSARYADIVLPACTFFEQQNLIMPPGGSPGVHSYLQLQDKVIEPLYECKPDVEILRQLAQRMGFGEHFQESDEEFIDLLLSWEHPSVAGITLDKLKEGPVQVPPYDVPAFLTPSGRMEFYCEKLIELGQQLPCYIEPLEGARKPLTQRYPLTFLNTHTRYRTHSIFTNVAWMTEFDPEPVLEISPADAEARGVGDGDVVRVFNDRGRMKLKAKVHQGIRPGTVNVTQGWWPEHFLEGSHQDLTHSVINPAQQAIYEPNAALYDVAVEVKKVGEE